MLDKNNKFSFKKSITDAAGFIQITLFPGAYEIENLNNEIRGTIIEQNHYTEKHYPIRTKPTFTTLGSIIGIPTQGPVITFIQNASLRDLLGFNRTTIYAEFNLSPNRVDTLSFDNIFLECKITQEMTFQGRRKSIVHNFTMDVDPGYKLVERFRGGVQWYMMHSKDIISTICFKLKNENGKSVSFRGQSVTVRLFFKEI